MSDGAPAIAGAGPAIAESGPAFADTILTLADGPHRFAKQFAWATMADRIRPPPLVPALKLTP